MVGGYFKSLLRRLGILLAHYERVLLALLSVVIVLSGSVWYRQFAATRGDQPTAGGTYVTGVVGDNQVTELLAAKLTKAGLFTFDSSGRLVNLLVSDWQVNDQKTEYRFWLYPGISLQEIEENLQLNSDILGPAIVSDDQGQLVITLQEPNPNIPLVLAQPFFDYGPYKVSKSSSDTIILSRNTRAHAVSAYINKVIIHRYENEALFKQALAKHKIDGGLTSDATFQAEGYRLETFSLSRYYTIFLNINKSPFREASFRQQVINGQTITNKAFTLIAPTDEPYQTLAKDIVNRWQTAGANVTLELRSADEIQNKIAPSRDFQALLSGVDYGYELDPYYLWHSSQIRPPSNNLTGVKSDKVDTAITQLRQTTNITERQNLITGIHQLLKDEAVAVFVKQESASFIVANTVRVVNPWVPAGANDYLQSIALWSVK